jgi:hypothetical protein
VCPVEAIFYADDTPEQWKDYYKTNVEFFDDLGSPGGAAKLGMIPKGRWLVTDYRRMCTLPRPDGTSARLTRRVLLNTTLSLSCALVLSGCGESVKRGLLPHGVTSESGQITTFWNGSLLAALGVGVLVRGIRQIHDRAVHGGDYQPEHPQPRDLNQHRASQALEQPAHHRDRQPCPGLRQRRRADRGPHPDRRVERAQQRPQPGQHTRVALAGEQAQPEHQCRGHRCGQHPASHIDMTGLLQSNGNTSWIRQDRQHATDTIPGKSNGRTRTGQDHLTQRP